MCYFVYLGFLLERFNRCRNEWLIDKLPPFAANLGSTTLGGLSSNPVFFGGFKVVPIIDKTKNNQQ